MGAGPFDAVADHTQTPTGSPLRAQRDDVPFMPRLERSEKR
jgi:hypothetical protein